MELDELLQKLQNTRALYPRSRVFIATPAQVLRTVPGMNTAYRLPIAGGSCLGDQDGEVNSLFVVVVES